MVFIYLLVDEGIAKLRYLKSYSTDDQSHQFVLKCPKVSCTRHRGRNGFKVGGAKHFFDQAKYILVLLIKCTKCMHASVIKRNKMPCN